MLTTMPACACRRAPIRPAAPARAPDPARAQAPPVDALRWPGECQCESCFALRIKGACRSVRRPRASRPTEAQARRSVRAARAPVVLRGPLCLLPRRGRRKRQRACQSVGRLARGRRTCRPAGRMNGSPETCNVIHYQTIGKRKAGRHATLFIIKPSASEKSPSVIGPVSSTDGVCIGILRSEANSQQTEIDREIKMYFNK